MSKVFSIIGMETNTGIRDIGIIGGIPEVEDIQNSQIYKELVEDCGGSEYISVVVKSFRYGAGEPQAASMEDLEWLSPHPELVKSDKVTHLKTANLAILYPEQEMQFHM